MPGGADEGLYGALHTALLERRPQGLPDSGAIFPALGKAAAPDVLARYVAEIVRRLASTNDDGQRRQDLLNRLVDRLEALDDDAVIKLEELLANSVALGVYKIRLASPLSCTALVANTNDEPSLGAKFEGEMASADSVDLLCAFVWHGTRLLTGQLDDLRRPGKPLRVITTTHLGGIERGTIDQLVRLNGLEVRTHCDSDATRLRAKVWFFRCHFGAATVGSSKLCRVPSHRWCANQLTAAPRARPSPQRRTRTRLCSGDRVRVPTARTNGLRGALNWATRSAASSDDPLRGC